MVKITDEELLIEATGVEKAAAIYFITKINKKYENWDAYKLGLIDRNGKTIREPENSAERKSLGFLEKIVIKIKNNLPKSVLMGLSGITIWKILSEETDEPRSFTTMNEDMAGIFLRVLTEAADLGIDEKDALRWLLDRAEVQEDGD